VSSSYAPTSRRPIAQALRGTADGATRWCVARDVHPDAISYSSIAVSLAAGLGFWQAGHWPCLLIPAAILCYVRLWLNMLDGMVALASGKASKRGEILNELPDRVSDVLIFAGVAHSTLSQPLVAYWVIIFALLTAYVGTLGQAIGAGRQFGGIMAKPWRMVVLHVGAWVTLVLIWTGMSITYGGLTVLDYTMLVIIIGCVQTIVVRLNLMLANLERR